MTDCGDEVLHVFDLPQLYQRPSASALLSALGLLTTKPRSWQSNVPAQDQQDDGRPRVHPDGVTAYLTKIVASPLGWIEEDDVRESVWESASLRLAERSGRTAMPAMERTFSIPSAKAKQDISLLIHEPALTADNLGLKTWAASFLLAQRLHHLDLPSLRDTKVSRQQYQILELGSGTGLVGMAAAAVLGTGVVLTDLHEIEANLSRNVEANRKEMAAHGGFATTAVLNWSKPSELSHRAAIHTLDARNKSALASLDCQRPLDNATLALPTPPDSALATPAAIPMSFPIIVAADCIYDPAHPAMLIATIKTWLSLSDESRVIIELPTRDAYLGDIEALRDGMIVHSLILIEEGWETGVDDWGGDDDVTEVKCWWGVWKWDRAQV